MNKTIIIAEAGVNHNGSLQLAKQLVDVAAEAGADYVKFQTFKANKIASKQAQKAIYQQQTTDNTESQLEMLERLELDEMAHLELINYCQEKNIAFLSTAFDFDSIELLKKLGITLGKIPSGELTNLPYLRKMAKAFPKLILSTGMADMKEINDTINALIEAGAERMNLTVLHCNDTKITEIPSELKNLTRLYCDNTFITHM